MSLCNLVSITSNSTGFKDDLEDRTSLIDPSKVAPFGTNLSRATSSTVSSFSELKSSLSSVCTFTTIAFFLAASNKVR